MSSACAFANADARAATDSLDRGMVGLRRREKVEAHCPRFGPLPSHAMPDRLPRILGHQRLELVFRPLMVEKGLAGVAEHVGEFGPGIRCAHIDDADRLNARPRLFGI